MKLIWSFHINQAQYIAQQADYPYIVEQRNFDLGVPFYRFAFGNAILSRYPIKKAELINFSPYSKLEDIFAGNHDGVLAIIETPLGILQIAAIHLEYRSEAIRFINARQLNDITKQNAFPMLAIGDFNSTPLLFSGAQRNSSGDNALSYLLQKAGFQADPSIANNVQYYTFPSHNPTTIIDWILVKGNVVLFDFGIVNSKLSDHYMITSMVTTKP